jgi:hypothetical protein
MPVKNQIISSISPENPTHTEGSDQKLFLLEATPFVHLKARRSGQMCYPERFNICILRDHLMLFEKHKQEDICLCRFQKSRGTTGTS